PTKAFVLSVIGNAVPVIPLLFLLDPVTKYLRSIPVMNKYQGRQKNTPLV
ncbi:hypothetical protein SAMN04488698_1441, partial [Candidatus Frackibacter sp. WG12]